MTQLEKLIKQYDIYITYMDYHYPNFRCTFVLPKIGIACTIEGRNMRQMNQKMVERIEEELQRNAVR